jgi:ketopantoate hydroxymethyltransferase
MDSGELGRMLPKFVKVFPHEYQARVAEEARASRREAASRRFPARSHAATLPEGW